MIPWVFILFIFLKDINAFICQESIKCITHDSSYHICMAKSHCCFALMLTLFLKFQEPIKSRAPQLHLEYRFYKQLGNSGKTHILSRIMCFMFCEKSPPPHPVWDWSCLSCVLRIMGAASFGLLLWLLQLSTAIDGEKEGRIEFGVVGVIRWELASLKPTIRQCCVFIYLWPSLSASQI